MRQTPEESWKAFTTTGSVADYLAYRSITAPDTMPEDKAETDSEIETTTENTTLYL